MNAEPDKPPAVHAAAAAPRRRRSAPWLLGGLVLALLFVLVALQVAGLWEVVTPDTATDTLSLYALSSLNFAAFIVFTFIFVRNLLKLRRERRARVLGSKIKTRLIVYFITISLLPITAMAIFSYLFFTRSLEKWFSRLPEDVVKEAKLARDEANARDEQALGDMAALLAALLANDAPAPDTAPAEAGGLPAAQRRAVDLPALVQSGQLAALVVLAGPPADARRTEVFAPAYAGQEAEVRAALAETQAQLPSARALATHAGRFTVARAPIGPDGALLVVRESREPPHLGRIITGAETFEQLRRRQRRVRLLGLSTLGLLTLLLLFAATWSAIHLARGIGTPIRALAEAADEVARGNLAHRVTAIAEDELALLAASFNQMTAQLQENRRRIEAGAAELREKNLALDERRNYIETVLESLSTGVVSLDEHDRVTTINAAAVLMLRLSVPPAPGTPLADMTTAEDRALLERVLMRARRAGRAAWQLELARGAHADGAGRPVALTATALGPPATEPRGVVLVIEDLSELLAAQRAAAWSEVARRMAHEIKNPLTPIQLSAERIARNFQRANGPAATPPAGPPAAPTETTLARPAEQERVARIVGECTATITREVAGLKAMVDEFSRFARLPHARLEPAELNEIVRQAVALYEDRLEGVRVDVRLGRALPAALLDAEQMRRVLVNLIDNALEALAEQPGPDRRVTVATGYDPARGLLLLEVADTGHGIARADVPRLFQPYFSTRGRGTGLGLAIVQRIIIEHGGRIRAEVNRPRGAQFIVELPAADETRSEPGGGSGQTTGQATGQVGEQVGERNVFAKPSADS